MSVNKRTTEDPAAARENDVRGKFRYRLVFILLRPFVRFLMWLLFNYKAIPFHEDKQQTYFILSNHTGALDPLLLALSFKRPIFFVASDHIFRLGWISRLLHYLVAPIPIVKSKLDLKALRTIKSELESGRTVSLFPSGNRSVSGAEEPIPPATAKLIKMLPAPVLLYRLEGGYLTSPRWAKHHRRGKMIGSVIMHFTLDDLERIPAPELAGLLKTYLDANPYKSPQTMTIPYRGRKLAEALERIIYLCPGCDRLASLNSRDDELYCDCGFSLRYQPTGEFASNTQSDWATRFPNIHSLYEWQTTRRKALFTEASLRELPSDRALFTDEAETLHETQRAARNIKLLTGRMSLYKDRLVYVNDANGEELSFRLSQISDTSVIGPQRIQFTDQQSGKTYESQNQAPRSAYKYVELIAMFKKLQGKSAGT